jgi:hypothetical protein
VFFYDTVYIDIAALETGPPLSLGIPTVYIYSERIPSEGWGPENKLLVLKHEQGFTNPKVHIA